MISKRSWFGVLAILGLAVVALMGAERSRSLAIGEVVDPTCTSSLPCIEYDNTSTGPGVRGVSLLGNGVNGQTKFNSTSSSNGKTGVFGNDVSTSGSFNAGVKGQSVRGIGVLGQSTSSDGVFGSSTGYVGVYGTSNGYLGVFGKGPTYGVAGSSAGGVGVYGTSNTSDAVRGIIGSGVPASFHAGVAGLDSSSSGTTNEGVYGQTNLGIGVQAVALGSGTGLSASSGTGVGANITGGSASLPALSIVQSGSSDLIDACLAGTVNPCDRSHEVFRIGPSGAADFKIGYFCNPACVNVGIGVNGGDIFTPGNIDIDGQYQKSGSCVAGCSAASATSPGRAVVSYVPTQSSPTIEDFGEATLQSGIAYVRLDPAFANVIDHGASYLVFITPEGDSRGLYVTERSIRGFAVHENMSGRSTLTFSYRIVAKPLGSHEQRLPMVTLPQTRSRSLPVSMFHGLR